MPDSTKTPPATGDDGSWIDREEYLTERARLIELEEEECKGSDSVVTLVAGGALALSLSFLALFRQRPLSTWMLFASWVSFGTSLLATVASHLTSMHALRKQRDLLDDHYEKQKSGAVACAPRWPTVTLNWVALATLAAGVIAIVWFATANLGRGRWPIGEPGSQDTRTEGATHDTQLPQETRGAPAAETTKAASPKAQVAE